MTETPQIDRSFAAGIETRKIDRVLYLKCAVSDLEDAVRQTDELQASPNYKETAADREEVRKYLVKLEELGKKLPQ